MLVPLAKNDEIIEAIRMFFERYIWERKIGFSDGGGTLLAQRIEDATKEYYYYVKKEAIPDCMEKLEALKDAFHSSFFAFYTQEVEDIPDTFIQKYCLGQKNKKFVWSYSPPLQK